MFKNIIFLLSVSLYLVLGSMSGLAYGATAPLAPSNLTLTSVTTTSATITWKASTSWNVRYYVVYSSGTQIAKVLWNVHTFKDSSLKASTAYSFTVKAQSGRGLLSIASNILSVKTLSSMTPAPVNGVCGSSNGVKASSAPKTNLCSTGTATSVNGSGPWSWSCGGSNGGTTVACTAPLQTETITVSAGSNGTITPSGSVSVNYGASQKFTLTPSAGYTASLKVDGAAVALTNNTYTLSDVTATHTVTASFSKNSYLITVSAGSNGTITPSGSVSVNSGASQTFTLTPNAGYTAHLTVDGSAVTLSNNTYTLSNVTATHTLAANFTLQSETITASAGSNGIITPSGSVSVNYGATQTFTLIPSSGYTANLTVDGIAATLTNNTFTLSNITAAHTLAASFILKTENITVTAGSNGTITPSGSVSVNYGVSQTFTLTPSLGYTASLMVDGTAVTMTNNTYTLNDVTAVHTLAASFKLQTETITATAGSNGTITPSGSMSVNYGASQTFTLTPTSGYTAHLTVDGSAITLTNNTYTLSDVTAAHTVAASFALQSETITAFAGSNGTIAPSGSVSVNYGASQTFTVTPGTGYTASLTVDGVGVAMTNNTYTLSDITAAHTVTASFTLQTETITASAGNNGTITPSGSVNVNYGASQTFTVTPNAGYTSTLTVDGVSAVLTNNAFTLSNITSTHTVIATFTLQKNVACPQGTSYADGCAAAPAGTPQYSGLLSTYGANRSPWNVPGVDYAVGVPAGTVLQDPTATGTLPSCATYNASTHAVTVNSNNCTLNGFDFTKAGGLQIYIPSATGTIIENSLFGASTNAFSDGALIDNRGTSITVLDSTFANDTQGNVPYFAPYGSGTYTFEYNSFYNLDGDALDFGPAAYKTVVKYNAFVQLGMNAESHPDPVQFCGGTLDPASAESYNFIYQTKLVQSQGEEGIQVSVQCTNPSITGYSADHNTLIAQTGAPAPQNVTMSYVITIDSNATNVQVNNNYMDARGAYGYFYPMGNASDICNNNMAMAAFGGVSAGSAVTGTFGSMVCTAAASTTPTPIEMITATAGSNGTITPSGSVSVNSGASQTFTITPGTGYTASLTVDGAAVTLTNNTYTLSDVTTAHTVTVSFALQTESITATAGSNGSISPSGISTVNFGASKTYTIIPNSGYQIAGVTVNGTALTGTLPSTYAFANVTSNQTINVTFAATPPAPINGACGTANGAAVSSAPSTNLCSAGTATAVSGSGPWSWSCAGSNGGTTSSCADTYITTSNPCPKGSGYADGCSGASTGSPQFSTMLSTYTARPAWNVAGVDYPVGVPGNTVLKDPTTAALPSGCSLSGTTVTCSGSNITLNGYDFSLHNGTTLNVTGSNITVENSLFVVGNNQGALGRILNVASSASNISFLNNEFNGANIAVTVQAGQTINVNSTGTITFEYNYFHNSGGDMIDFSGGPQVQIIKYNLWKDIGLNTAHSDTVQWCGSKITSADLAFNVIDQSVSGLSGMGLLEINSECTGASMSNAIEHNNTLISKVQDNFAAGVDVTQDAGTATGDHVAIFDNYVDPTGINSYTGSPWFPTGSYAVNLAHPTAMYGLINMLTGAAIPIPTASSKTSQGYYTYPDSSGYSPSLNDVYTITPSPASGTVNAGGTVTFTLNMDEPWTVTGTPTLSLNDGGIATYLSGSGTNTLVFSYTVTAGNTATTALAVTGFNLPSGASLKDNYGNLANLANVTATFSGLAVTPSVAPTPVNGTCGTSNGVESANAPSTNLCINGGASAVTESGTTLWDWTCSGSNGGSNASCSAPVQPEAVNGACGTANGVESASAPSMNLCSTGNASAVTESQSILWDWTCAGSNSGATVSCSAPVQPAAVNGTCGAANGTVAGSAPTSNLCSTGTATTVSGSGPWSWNCDGSSGGTNASCFAPSSVSGTYAWNTLKVGAGGYVRGLNIAPDGTMVARTDTYGAYLWSGTQWQQLVTSTRMPSAFVWPADAGGVYEIQIAPSNTQILYMSFNGYVFKSTNQGTTWTQTSFTAVTENANDNYGQEGQKMAIDPNNPNIVYVGTPSNGLFVTTNGGATWSSVAGVPISKTDSSGNYPGISGMLFDPAIGGAVGGVTQTIFAESYGNGVYESTNGGSSWTLLNGSPTAVWNAAVASTGVYYATDGTDLWRYASGTWTNLGSNNANSGIQAVAVNPSNANEIVIVDYPGAVNISYNAGSTWSGWYAPSPTSADIPWIAAANVTVNNPNSYWLTPGGAAFNPLVANQLMISAGTGVWNLSVPTSGVAGTPSWFLTYVDQSVGIEQLVANEIISPPGGNPVLASWDRPFFEITNPDAYPSTYGPVNSDNIVAGWSVDYASATPSFLVGLADWWGTEETGYSTNGGATWTKFPTEIPGAAANFMGGTIAASTTQNFIWAPADNEQPYYTLNGGTTWTGITLPGVTSWNGFDWAYYLKARTVTADRVLPNTFYLFYAGSGLYMTTNGGATWTKQFSGDISSFDGYNAELKSVPGEAGNLFFSGGPQGTVNNTAANEPFMRSINGGATWTAVPNVLDVLTFGYGAAAPGQSYPAIYIVGWVNNVYGVWQSNDNASTWVNIGTYPVNSLDEIVTISGDANTYGKVYLGFTGSGYAYRSLSS